MTTDPTETLSFGKWIQQQRTLKNVSLEEIAAVTKVHIAQLKHLEADERSQLPAPAFVRGFLISYARHLGLSEDEVLAKYKEGQPNTGTGDLIGRSTRAAQPGSQSKVKLVESSTLTQAPGAKDLERPIPPLMKTKNLLIIAGILIVLVGMAALISIGKKNKKKAASAELATATSSPETSAPPPALKAESEIKENKKEVPSEPPTPKVAEAKTPVTPPPAASAATDKKYKMELRAVEQSWVNVRVDDGDSAGQMLVPGNNLTFEADRKVALSLSDAGSVEIRWNGTWYSAPGFRGDVKSLTFPEQIAKLSVRTGNPAMPRKKKVVAPSVTAPAPGAEATASPDAPAAAPKAVTPTPDATPED